MDDNFAVNQKRILKTFVELTAFDAESFHEKGIAAHLEHALLNLGLAVTKDPSSHNILAVLRGGAQENDDTETLLFAAHMDTVRPGNGKKAIVHTDGKITSDGTTVLGADDVSGLSAILEALQVIQEQQLPHPTIEVLFTAAEEPYCEGSRYVDYQRIKAKTAYVLDLDGPVGRAAIAAPTILAVKVKLQGKAAHAGFAPEAGINVFTILGKALSRIKTGWVKEGTTVNFGTIQGGMASNIVPDEVTLSGEIRSLDHEEALSQAREIERIFKEEAEKLRAIATVEIEERLRAYRIRKSERVVSHFIKAAKETVRCHKPECITTNGGSDANRLNEHGIPTIVIACGMNGCHTVQEYTSVDELTRSAELTLRLMTGNGA